MSSFQCLPLSLLFLSPFQFPISSSHYNPSSSLLSIFSLCLLSNPSHLHSLSPFKFLTIVLLLLPCLLSNFFPTPHIVTHPLPCSLIVTLRISYPSPPPFVSFLTPSSLTVLCIPFYFCFHLSLSTSFVVMVISSQAWEQKSWQANQNGRIVRIQSCSRACYALAQIPFLLFLFECHNSWPIFLLVNSFFLSFFLSFLSASHLSELKTEFDEYSWGGVFFLE